MFRNRHRAPEPTPTPDTESEPAPDQTAEFNEDAPDIEALISLRTKIFDVLEHRLGKDSVDGMRADFDAHLASDPTYGAEAGWVCLVGKMIKALDRLTEALMAAEQGIGLTAHIRESTPGIEGFTFFGKAS